jgi:hypothetical protein
MPAYSAYDVSSFANANNPSKPRTRILKPCVKSTMPYLNLDETPVVQLAIEKAKQNCLNDYVTASAAISDFSENKCILSAMYHEDR